MRYTLDLALAIGITALVLFILAGGAWIGARAIVWALGGS